MTIVKTYGIYKNVRGRYAVTTDISDDKRYYSASDTLTYTRQEFALKQAESFIRHCHKDFTNFQGVPIHFEFKNMGLINTVQLRGEI